MTNSSSPREEAFIATETELKLAVSARHLAGLQRALETRAGGGGARSLLVSTYFDTSDHALAQRGLALRVREKDGAFVQTVKSDAAAGATALIRGEWEDTVTTARPDPAAAESGRFLDRELAGRLIPLFRTEI